MTHYGRIGWTWKFLLVLGLLVSEQLAFAPPDLVINRGRLRHTVEVVRVPFTRASCDYQEGCLRGWGRRKLLKVDVGIANIGPHDLVIGNPKELVQRGSGLFVWSDCHYHWHMKTMVQYRLLNRNYTVATRGRKQAFCLRDNEPYTGWAGPSKGYNCDFQGITAGWQDIYDKSLDCQYVDITGVPPGNYFLEVTVNPARVVREQNYSNNRVLVWVTVPY